MKYINVVRKGGDKKVRDEGTERGQNLERNSQEVARSRTSHPERERVSK